MEQKDYRLAAIMYTDIVGFSRMMEKDESGTLEILRFHNSLISDIAARRHGTVIKTIGDAFLVDFRNTVEALQCAMDVQAAIYEHNKRGEGQPLLLRIGLHLGDIYFFENDALGEDINIASRLQSFARPGTICFSQDVYNQVLNKLEFRAEKLGKVSLKNITKEIHAYEIASPNVEFDPNRDKPRAGFKPEPAPPAEARPTGEGLSEGEPAAGSFARTAPLPGAASPSDRGYGPEAAKAVLDDIRKAILEDTKRLGRRLTVGEALDRYGEYGVEAKEVIASMAEKGLLEKRSRGASYGSAASEGAGSGAFFGAAAGKAAEDAASDLAGDIGRAVEGIARAIEQGVGEWQRGSQDGRSRDRDRDDRGRGGHGGRRADEGEEAFSRRAGRAAARAVDKIEREIDRMAESGEKRTIKAEFKRHEAEVATGKWDAELRGSEHFKPGPEELETDFSRYRDKIEEKGRKATSGFIGNAVSFAAVNAVLWYVNMNFAPGFMWAAIVTAGWGTGLVSNFFAMLRGKTKAAEVERMPELDSEALDVYKKLHRVRDGMAMHFASIVSVPPLLFVINVLTSPSFLWAAIPSIIMGASFLAHCISYPGTKRGLEKKLLRLAGADSWKELFRMGKGRKAGAGAGPYAGLYAEVATIRDEIARDLKAGKGGPDFGKDMIPALDRYVDQVKLLTHSINEIDGLVSGIPLAALRDDMAALSAKRSSTESPALKDEYARSIAEIERQEKACKDLEDQRELLRLRLSSSVNALKQLKLDMARLNALPESGERQAMEDIRRKARELSGYLDDLKTGYAESQADPYAELERLAAEADARSRLEAAGEKPEPPAE